MKNQTLAITTGDHHGIGPEVIAKSIFKLRTEIKSDALLIFGAPELYFPYRKYLPKKWKTWTEDELFEKGWAGPLKANLNFLVPDLKRIPNQKHSAYSCGRYIELAVRATMADLFCAVVTGPIDKSELVAGGYNYYGHTEMLADLCKSLSVTMMLAGPKIKVTLVTNHVSLKEVSSSLSIPKIQSCIENTARSLIQNFGIKNPRIAVLALNPHAGDNRLFGDEEVKIIGPAISAAAVTTAGAHIEGPFAADGFFAQWQTRHFKNYDAVVCMYHDQGLVPAKLLDFENLVNITLGIPIIRTSVDHGTARDIAGKNKADPSSMIAALRMARQLSSKRFKINSKKDRIKPSRSSHAVRR